MLVSGSAAVAQTCQVTATAGTAPTISKMVHFTFAGTENLICEVTQQVNANCYQYSYFVGRMNSETRPARGMGTGPNPVCGFACGFAAGQYSVGTTLCNVTLDSSDGLPVELLKFEIDPQD
jgi:hypothetical protein